MKLQFWELETLETWELWIKQEKIRFEARILQNSRNFELWVENMFNSWALAMQLSLSKAIQLLELW